MSLQAENDAKKAKIETESLENILNKFEFVRVLNDVSMSKLIFIEAESKDQNSENRKAVIIFEKPHFGSEEVKALLSVNNPIDTDIENDIYKKLCVYPSKPYSGVQVQLIYPATEAHISKYSYQEAFYLRETYQDWLEKTSVYIKNSLNLQWVYNILEHKTESERIIYEDTDPVNGFILLPDMKWDGKVVENLYLLAIAHQKNIQSLRDLNASHIPLLENVRDKCMQTIESKFGIKKHAIRAYIHYQPTFYHLHVHFVNMKYQAPGFPERNHSLTHVIENLRVDGEYYKKATLECVIKKNEALYTLFKDRFE